MGLRIRAVTARLSERRVINVCMGNPVLVLKQCILSYDCDSVHAIAQALPSLHHCTCVTDVDV